MKFSCEDCGYVFGRNQELIKHKPRCKKGVKTKEIYTCEGCSKEYTMKSIFLKHIDACKIREEKIKVKLPEQQPITEEVPVAEEQPIPDVKEESIISTIEDSLENQNKKIEKLALEIAELKKKPSIVVNKTVINNIIKNKYVQNNMLLYGLKPLDLSQERFNEIVDNKYSYKVYTNYGIVKDVFLNFFSNEEGEVCVMLSDRDRMKLKCIDKDKGIIYHDPKSMVGMCSSSEPLKEKTKEYEEQLTTNVYGEPNTVNIEDALKRREIIKDEKGMKRLMSQSSEKFLKKEISPDLLKMVDEKE